MVKVCQATMNSLRECVLYSYTVCAVQLHSVCCTVTQCVLYSYTKLMYCLIPFTISWSVSVQIRISKFSFHYTNKNVSA